jgi:hypothetical protein
LPKNWNKLSIDEQREWINTYYMPKTRIPEQYPKIDEIAKGQKIKTQKGFIIKIPKETRLIQKNPNVVREWEMWIGKWLFTVFHDKNCPATKYIALANPQTEKWIAQELTKEILEKINALHFKIGYKYGLINRKNLKPQRKNSDFSLRLKNTREASNIG